MRALDSVGRTALVHDWLVGWGGSESVLAALTELFPDSPVYTAVWAPDRRVAESFEGVEIRDAYLSRVPLVRRVYRWLLPLMPGAYRSLDLSGFDLVVSSCHAFSKAVAAPEGAVHVCYCHTPPRYLWDLYDIYNRGLGERLRRNVLRWLREQDLRAAEGVDHFVANSHTVADRIRRTYGRDATVIHPPAEVELFREARRSHDERLRRGERGSPGKQPAAYYLAGGRMVRYKRVDLAVRAATAASLPLKVFGDGPERARLERGAGPTVEFLGRVGSEELAGLAAGCRAYLFPGEEDFGILPVEIQAAGRPVVAWKRGGARETVVDGVTGVLYDEGSVEGLLAGVRRSDGIDWDPETITAHAERFGRGRFLEEIRTYVARVVESD